MSNLEYEQSETLGSRVELYLFETDDGLRKWAYTTDRTDRVFGTSTYMPEAISRSALKQTAGDANVEKITVTVPFDNPVAVLHVPYLPPRPIRLTIFTYQRNDTGSEMVQAFFGHITSFNQKGDKAELECSQILDNLSQTVPWAVFKPGCIWALYQIGCGVDKFLFTATTEVITVNADIIQAAEFLAKPPDYYKNGFAYDPITTEQRFITAHDNVAGTIRLVYPFLDMSPGRDLIVYAGCARTKEVCSTKFNNKINYVGFDHFPNYNVFQQGIT